MNLLRPARPDVVDRPLKWRPAPLHLSYAELALAECLGVSSYAPKVSGFVVGMNPGPHTDPEMPLFPRDEGCAAGRLLSYSGLTIGQYLGGLVRRNLCNTTEWRAEKARRRARRMITCLFDLPSSLAVVMLGRKVAESFEHEPIWWTPKRLITGQWFVMLPHPSGKNLAYNDERARQLTGRWLRWAALGGKMP